MYTSQCRCCYRNENIISQQKSKFIARTAKLFWLCLTHARYDIVAFINSDVWVLFGKNTHVKYLSTVQFTLLQNKINLAFIYRVLHSCSYKIRNQSIVRPSAEQKYISRDIQIKLTKLVSCLLEYIYRLSFNHVM